jgi:hypothetical protein
MSTTQRNLSTYLPDITLFGDWDKVNDFMTALPLAVTTGAREGSETAAKKLISVVKKNIRNNGPAGVNWEDYSLAYSKRKARLGGNIDTKWSFHKTYYNSLGVITRGNKVYAGVPPRKLSTVNTRKPITLAKVARILENGSPTLNIKARPLWKPSFKEFGGKARIQSHIYWHIRKHLAIAGILNIKLTR